MSLLLEALKKAEKAKEEAQRRTSGEDRAELRLQDDAVPAAEEKQRVLTRPELPDISQSLEILSYDITPRTCAAAPGQRRTPADPAAAERRKTAADTASATSPRAARREAAEPATDRAAARKVFEAKFSEPNPRLPFYAAIGVLGVAVLCTVVYFWLQLRPAPSLVNANPPPTSAQPAAAQQPLPVATAAPAAPAQTSIPGLPGATVVPAVPAAPVRSPLREDPRPSATPAARPAGAPTSTAPRPLVRSAPLAETAAEPRATRPAPQVHPNVQAGYAAYLSGNLAAARTDYEQALRDDPANRDALLGLAAVDVRNGRLEAAEATYLQLLRADPRDAHAQAALIALRGGRMDPMVTESRIKTLLAADPSAHVLRFALGNQLAQQARWPEAQQEFFKAYAADPENADFAYNLAVSLDHLRQPKLALEYYQRALALAAKRGASFDERAARERVMQLGN